jgi:hypothetical protein
MAVSDAITRYLNSKVKNLESATLAVLGERSRLFAQDVKKQLRTRFKKKVGGVKVRDFPPRGKLGPASIVSIKPAFLQVFETPRTIAGRNSKLVIPTDNAKLFGLGRVGKAGLRGALARFQGKYRVAKEGEKTYILLPKNGKLLIVYVIQPQVQTKKLLNIREDAERRGVGIDRAIEELVED